MSSLKAALAMPEQWKTAVNRTDFKIVPLVKRIFDVLVPIALRSQQTQGSIPRGMASRARVTAPSRSLKDSPWAKSESLALLPLGSQISTMSLLGPASANAPAPIALRLRPSSTQRTRL